MNQGESREAPFVSYIDANFMNLETCFQQADSLDLPRFTGPAHLRAYARSHGDMNCIAAEAVPKLLDSTNEQTEQTFIEGVGLAYLTATVMYRRESIPSVNLTPQEQTVNRWRHYDQLKTLADEYVYASPSVYKYYDQSVWRDSLTTQESAAAFFGFFCTSALIEGSIFNSVASEAKNHCR